jgi:hypothetical protein
MRAHAMHSSHSKFMISIRIGQVERGSNQERRLLFLPYFRTIGAMTIYWARDMRKTTEGDPL